MAKRNSGGLTRRDYDEMAGEALRDAHEASSKAASCDDLSRALALQGQAVSGYDRAAELERAARRADY